MFDEMRTFFEDHHLAREAASSLRNGRKIRLSVTGAAGTEDFVFMKESGRNKLEREAARGEVDVEFLLTERAARDLVTGSYDTVGQVGLRIFDMIMASEPDRKIRIRLNAGVLTLVTGGYLGVLTAGGGEVAKFLATKGLGNMGKLKEALSKFRSGS